MIDKKQLNKRLTQSIKSFGKLGDTSYHDGLQLTHIDNGSDILAVGHLDVVLKATPVFKGDVVKAPQLDDRLGAYIILDLLPKLGLKYDLLLCDGEEQGLSTARQFIPHKNYKWAFEFDRQGTDSVLYDYESNEKWRKAVAGFSRIGCGSFSDISELTDWGFCAVNWGCGYHLQHSFNCYADLRDTSKMVAQFVKFYKAYRHKTFKYTYKPVNHTRWGVPGWQGSVFDRWEAEYRTFIQKYGK
jgi:hypothetical protein